MLTAPFRTTVLLQFCTLGFLSGRKFEFFPKHYLTKFLQLFQTLLETFQVV